LNLNYPVEPRPETKASVVGIDKNESRTIKDDNAGSRKAASMEVEEEDEGGKIKEEKSKEMTKEEGKEKLNIRYTDKEVQSLFEQEGEGDRKEEMQKKFSEEKEKEVEEEERPEKLSRPPMEESSIEPQPEQQPSPAEENTFEVEPSEDDKAVVEEPKVPTPLVRK